VNLLEPSEEIVVAWLNQKGFFTLNNYKVGNKEIDVLAFKPRTGEKTHVEIGVSVNPVPPFGGIRKISKAPPLKERVKNYFEKKFQGTNDRTTKAVKEIFGTPDYQKMLVVGLLNPKYDTLEGLQQEFEKHHVKVVDFREVMKEIKITRTRYTDAREYIKLARFFKD